MPAVFFDENSPLSALLSSGSANPAAIGALLEDRSASVGQRLIAFAFLYAGSPRPAAASFLLRSFDVAGQEAQTGFGIGKQLECRIERHWIAHLLCTPLEGASWLTMTAGQIFQSMKALAFASDVQPAVIQAMRSAASPPGAAPGSSSSSDQRGMSRDVPQKMPVSASSASASAAAGSPVSSALPSPSSWWVIPGPIPVSFPVRQRRVRALVDKVMNGSPAGGLAGGGGGSSGSENRLSAEETEELIRLVEEDARLLLSQEDRARAAGAPASSVSILNPLGLSRMIESSPEVAACCLKAIHELHEKRGMLALGAVLPLWTVLIQEVAISMQSLDVVARLAIGAAAKGAAAGPPSSAREEKTTYLSADLLGVFIERCISTCDNNITEGEPAGGGGGRVVRLVSMFLSALLQRRCLSPDLIPTVSAFALRHGLQPLYVATLEG